MELTCRSSEGQGILAGEKFSHVCGALNKSKFAHILDLIRGNENQILEFGCGQGEVTRYLYEAGKKVIGVEKDPERAALARPFCNHLIIGDLLDQHTFDELGRLNLKFDLILFSEILEHLADPHEILLCSKPFLKQFGGIIVVLPNVAFYKTRLMLLRGKWNYADEGILDRTHLRFFTKFTSVMLLQEAGFNIAAVRGTHYSRRYRWMYDPMVRLWPALFAEQFVIRAGLTVENYPGELS